MQVQILPGLLNKKMFKRIKQFFGEVKAEMKKVSWPTAKETKASTLVVVVVVAILSAFIGVTDFVFSFIFSKVVFK